MLRQSGEIHLQFDRLKREVKYGEETLRRHTKSWRDILMKIAIPKMKKDLEYAWQNFERVLDAKDFTISLLLDELQEANEQYRVNISKHIDSIDNLLTLCYDQIMDIKSHSLKVIQQLYAAAGVEKHESVEVSGENESALKTMLYLLQIEKKESAKLIRGEYLSKQDFEIDRLNDARTKFTEELKLKYDRMYGEANDFLQDHIIKQRKRRVDYYQLMRSDEASQKIISAQWQHYKNQLDVLKSLHLYYNEYQYEQNKKINALSEGANHFQHVQFVVKEGLIFDKNLDDKKLLNLTLTSNKVIDYLKEIEKKGEKLLKWGQLCRKYETAQEKMLSFPVYTDSKPDPLDFLEDLKLFSSRVAQANLSRIKLMDEVKSLEDENEKLKQMLHEYCMCLSCSE